MNTSAVPFVLVSTEHGSMICNHLDRHEVSPGIGYGVGFQLLSRGAYEPQEIKEILEILENRKSTFGPGLVAVDCGANIGVISIEMAKYMRSFGQVISIEPQKYLFYALCGNVVLANLFNVQPIYAAVGATSGTMMVPNPNYTKSASFGSLELKRRPGTEYIGQSISYDYRNSTEVNVVSIDGLGLSRLDFLKIDVEGMELEVLEGAKNSISKFRPEMLIEVIKIDKNQLVSFLSELGYSFVERGMNVLASPN